MSTSPSDARLIAAYYDGRTAAARPATLSIDGQDLLLHTGSCELRWLLRDVTVSERLGSTPRLLTYAGGGHCEVQDHATLDRMLARAGMRRHWLERLHHSLPWAVSAVVLIAAVVAVTYRYVLPRGAEALAMRVPDVVLQKMGDSTLQALDRFALEPSKLDAARQQELRDAFARLRPLPGAHMQYRIVFRGSPRMGANAFALPDGTIVMLDGLVALAADDNEIAAVLAHERGHIERRHAMRMVLQNSVVGLALAWYAGDVSGLLATAPAVIMQAKYSRDMEREADDYAARTLQFNGLSPCLLATTLGKLEASHFARRRGAADPAADSKGQNQALEYLSSHPATRERAAQLCPGK